MHFQGFLGIFVFLAIAWLISEKRKSVKYTTILAGVIIESGATVSACSLVNGDVGREALVGGVPARVIGSDSET